MSSSTSEKFNGHLVVAVNGPIENPSFGVTVAGVHKLSYMFANVRKLLPGSYRMLLAHGNTSELKESADYAMSLRPDKRIAIPRLSETNYTQELADCILADLLLNDLPQYDVLVLMTTSLLSGSMPSGIHSKGRSGLNLREAVASVTLSDGKLHLVSSDGIISY